MENGGETGIRTLGTLSGSTVFETAPFDHSGTSPRFGVVRRGFRGEGVEVQEGFNEKKPELAKGANMLRIFSVVAAVMAMSFAVVPMSMATPHGRIAVTEAGILRIWRDLDMAALMPILHDEALIEAAQMQEDMGRRAGNAVWLRTVSRIHSPQRLKRHFMQGAAEALKGRPADRIERALTFYQTDLGRRVLRLETEARRAMLDPDTEARAEKAFWDAANRDHPRIDQIERLIEGADLIAPNVAGGLNALMAFSRGFAEGGGFDIPKNEQQMLDEAWAQEEEIRAQTIDWMEAYLFLAYAPLSDDELETYIRFAKSPEGKALSAVLFAGFDALFQQTSWELGLAAAGHMQGDHL